MIYAREVWGVPVGTNTHSMGVLMFSCLLEHALLNESRKNGKLISEPSVRCWKSSLMPLAF